MQLLSPFTIFATMLLPYLNPDVTEAGLDEAGRGCLAGAVYAAAVILPLLTEAEHDVYRRGRNSHVNTVPHGATPGQYHAATALEAVFGWLWLRGERERIHELFAHITEDYDAA